jgi:hypothetical protein
VDELGGEFSYVRQNRHQMCVLIAESSALSTFDLASSCLSAVRRQAGSSQADGSSLPEAADPPRRPRGNAQNASHCGRRPNAKEAPRPGLPRRSAAHDIRLERFSVRCPVACQNGRRHAIRSRRPRGFFNTICDSRRWFWRARRRMLQQVSGSRRRPLARRIVSHRLGPAFDKLAKEEPRVGRARWSGRRDPWDLGWPDAGR